MKKIFTLITVLISALGFSQPCPTFSTSVTSNFSVSCNSTISIVNPVSTQTPAATVSFSFLPPWFSGAVPQNTPLGVSSSTLAMTGGTWSVLVRDNSNFCTTTQTVFLLGPPFFTLAASNTSGTCNGTVTINPMGSSGYTVSATSGSVSGNTVSNLCAGPVKICLTNTVINCKRCDSIVLVNATGLHELKFENGFSVYPNPTTSKFSIRNSNNVNANIRILSIDGKLMEAIEMKEEILEIGNLKAGIYFVEVSTNAGISRKKIIIME
jgi:hypothetical protein